MKNEAVTADWEERRLCPNEACIGVLNNKKQCSLCGWDDTIHSFLSVTNSSLQEHSRPTEWNIEEGGEEFLDRVLCPNDSCLGVLNQDNQCPLCGSSLAVSPHTNSPTL